MDFEERYGRLDRILHRIAFRAGRAQHAIADVEKILFRDDLAPVRVETPVFITALPRSGTTILLRLLWRTGAFASHTYRSMPFVMCPMLWNRFSSRFEDDDVERERAHDDGLMVSGKSPEAFEEVIWKYFWPDHYASDRISPWAPDETNPDFDAFFRSHMRKMIALHTNGDEKQRRYLSKNNLNIARLASLPAPMQKGTLLIPFRDPVQQAASMLRQHRRFLTIHDNDAFVQEYMEAIGHHEFGEGLRPINFDDWLPESRDPMTLPFWLQYWTAAYRYILKHTGPSIALVAYETLVGAPEPSLQHLANLVKVTPSRLTTQADTLSSPDPHSVDTNEIPPDVLDKAYAVHQQLLNEASV